MSSLYVVFRLSAYDIHSATLKVGKGLPRRASLGILVISQIYRSSDFLSLSSLQSLEKNSTDFGVISS
jgi:hypothetical protein